jgi:3-oxoacyl-[acyl-carrier protein] reductase
MNSNSVALVTGASRGLGRAIALSLARRGHRVVVNYAHSTTDAAVTVEQCRAAGAEVLEVLADVCDPAAVRTMIAQVESHFGPVEVLVNNATGPQPMLPLEDYTWADFQNQLDFFVKAPVLLMQSTLAKMKRARAGRVIMIGSEVVDLGNANFSAYVAAKGAMIGLTRAWATEFGPWNITVNLVAPGWIPVERHAGTNPNVLAAYARALPLGHLGAPVDVGETVAFLAGSSAQFITGQCLNVNGGNTF